MQSAVLPATRSRAEELPASFSASGGTPHLAVLLPLPTHTGLMKGQSSSSFTYHLLTHPDFDFNRPVEFDADSFVSAVLSYCLAQPHIDGVFGFDCFPSMLASVVTQELGLPGPSFRSVFACCNKFYMRRELTPEMEIAPLPCPPPAAFPAVLKVSDTQFYVGTRICLEAATWASMLDEVVEGLLTRGLAARQSFYFKWATRFGWAAAYGWSAPSDVVVAHVEPFLESLQPRHLRRDDDHVLAALPRTERARTEGTPHSAVSAHECAPELDDCGWRNRRWGWESGKCFGWQCTSNAPI